MKGLFSYDSPVISALNTMANAVMLNFFFILCSLPIVTIGCSATALFTASRKWSNDYPCIRIFFRTFRDSLKRMIPAWLILIVPTVLFGFSLYFSFRYQIGAPGFELFAQIVGAVLMLTALNMSSVLPLFYSRFDCTLGQLLSNGLRLVVAWPIRSTLMTVLMGFPIGLLIFLGPLHFAYFLPIWLLFYFVLMARLCSWIMKMPIQICEQELT